jgi:ADP-heptose:LPS heptosyltransferase
MKGSIRNDDRERWWYSNAEVGWYYVFVGNETWRIDEAGAEISPNWPSKAMFMALRERKRYTGTPYPHEPPETRSESLDGSTIIDMVGKTTWRQTVQLVAHAEGVLCPDTCLMHIAAALDVPAVVIAGGRLSPGFLAHESTVMLSRIGKFDCCAQKGCWRSRTVALNDGGEGDRSLCLMPVIYPDRAVPGCIDDIEPEEIAAAVRRVMAGRGKARTSFAAGSSGN